MIRGQRNYIRGNTLTLAVGLIESNGDILPICGPPSAIEKQTKNFIVIKPGAIPKGKLAKQIKYLLLKKAPPELKEKINLLSISEIENILPPGGGDISQNS